MSKKSKPKQPKSRSHLLHVATTYQLKLMYDAILVLRQIGEVMDDDESLERDESGYPLKWAAIDEIVEMFDLELNPEDEDF
jgi:hypothetical protein